MRLTFALLKREGDHISGRVGVMLLFLIYSTKRILALTCGENKFVSRSKTNGETSLSGVNLVKRVQNSV